MIKFRIIAIVISIIISKLSTPAPASEASSPRWPRWSSCCAAPTEAA